MSYVKASGPLPKSCFLLTFDDGLKEIYDIIAPILLRKGVPAVIFLNTAFIDNLDMAYDHKLSIIIERFLGSSPLKISLVSDILGKKDLDYSECVRNLKSLRYIDRSLIEKIGMALDIDFDAYLRNHPPYLSKDQILRLLAEGFYLGSHSIDHPLYRDIPLEEQLRQTTESIYYLKSLFGLNYSLFAFPHTDGGVSSIFFERLMLAKTADITFGTSGLLDDSLPNHIQRMSFEKPAVPIQRLLRRHLARRLYRRINGNSIIIHGT
jgi:peptidoglycan/xylan/chitin deacetylase (PgdA/CDA1 family)